MINKNLNANRIIISCLNNLNKKIFTATASLLLANSLHAIDFKESNITNGNSMSQELESSLYMGLTKEDKQTKTFGLLKGLHYSLPSLFEIFSDIIKRENGLKNNNIKALLPYTSKEKLSHYGGSLLWGFLIGIKYSLNDFQYQTLKDEILEKYFTDTKCKEEISNCINNLTVEKFIESQNNKLKVFLEYFKDKDLSQPIIFDLDLTVRNIHNKNIYDAKTYFIEIPNFKRVNNLITEHDLLKRELKDYTSSAIKILIGDYKSVWSSIVDENNNRISAVTNWEDNGSLSVLTLYTNKDINLSVRLDKVVFEMEDNSINISKNKYSIIDTDYEMEIVLREVKIKDTSF